MQTWFTSDTHFDHNNIIRYCARPFSTVDEMNNAIVARWNSVVSVNDTVYHLGDFTLGDIRHFTKWADRLNGNIRILPGSHDHPWLKDFKQTARVQVVAPLMSVEFPELMNGDYPQVIVLCHYSMQVWDRSHYGSWHLFGHSHGNLRGIGLSFDVGVDCTDFTPLPLSAVVEKMAHLVMVGGAGACPTADLARLSGCQAARRPDGSSPSGAEKAGLGKAAIWDVRRKICRIVPSWAAQTPIP